MSRVKRHIEPSATLVMNERMQQMEAEGKTVYRFGFGQSPFPVPEVLVERLKKYAHRKEYLPVQGLLALRSQIAQYYSNRINISINADQIVIGPGTKELIWTIIFLFEGEIILPSPSWVSYAPQAKLANKKIIWLPCEAKNNWIISPDAFEQAILSSPAPKLIVLNYPNNPSGSIPTKVQMEDLVSVARKHQVTILHDNIYGLLSHTAEDSSFYQSYPEGTILSDGLSKWCGAGGWRLGFHIFPKELVSLKTALITMASETFSCVATPIQYAAIAAYETHSSINEFLQKSNYFLSLVSKYVYNQLNEMAVSVESGQGGFYVFPLFDQYRKKFLTRKIRTNTDLCDFILKETGVAMLPGKAFGRPTEELSTRLAYVDFDGTQVINMDFDTMRNTPRETMIETCCPKIKQGLEELGELLAR